MGRTEGPVDLSPRLDVEGNADGRVKLASGKRKGRFCAFVGWKV